MVYISDQGDGITDLAYHTDFESQSPGLGGSLGEFGNEEFATTNTGTQEEDTAEKVPMNSEIETRPIQVLEIEWVFL